MKRISLQLVIAALIGCLLAVFNGTVAAQSVAQSVSNWVLQQRTTDKGWPRTFTSSATSFSVYQPQIEQWKDNQFAARAAVAVTTSQSKQPTYGVIWFTARTETDKANRLVTMTDFEITKVSFPTHPEQATDYRNLLQARVAKAAEVIALDRLLAEMAINEARTGSAGYQLKNDPPVIYFSTRPAILVLIDGEPVLRPVKDTNLSRVINTRVLILRDDAKGRYYLHLMDGWMEADAAMSAWSVTQRVPRDLQKALAAAAQTRQVDLLDGSGDRKPSLNEAMLRNALPTIYVSHKPTELLQTQGEPQFASVAGTQLLYVTNTENDIFVDTTTQQQNRYVLISGRWFHSDSMKGSWEFVPAERLPADFAKIPVTHEKASVLASVPGTPQAKEALIANEIPQTATITRSAAKLTVMYDGQPQFRAIENTQLAYAVNTQTPVIKVEADRYYAVQNGVWFVAATPNGTWGVASSVPSVIYTIPPSSPVHHVTYVKVYGATPEVVYVGYTPGYYGTVVSSSSVVVYGTGWYYPPYIGTCYYGASYTYGYGAGFTWSTSSGWGVAYGIGYGWSSYYYPAPVYAGYYPTYAYGGVAATNVYGQWGNVAYAGTRAAWANPYTGNVGQGGAFSGVNTATGTRYNGRGFTNTNVYTGTTVTGGGSTAYNPYTGRSAAGQTGVASNVYTGNAVAGTRGASYNPQTGIVSGGAAGATYNAATGQTTAGASRFAYNTKTDTGVAVGNNNVYAGRDGEVYRYNKTDGLQQHTSDGWSSVSRPTEAQSIQTQQAARATGQERWDSFRTSGGANGNAGVVGPNGNSGVTGQRIGSRNGNSGGGPQAGSSSGGPRFGSGNGTPRFGSGGGGPGTGGGLPRGGGRIRR